MAAGDSHRYPRNFADDHDSPDYAVRQYHECGLREGIPDADLSESEAVAGDLHLCLPGGAGRREFQLLGGSRFLQFYRQFHHDHVGQFYFQQDQ